MVRDELLTDQLEYGNFTANEVIEKIYKSDIKSGLFRTDWKFYNHLNKRFAPLHKKGVISIVGYKRGPTGKTEKVWGLTKPAGTNVVSAQVAVNELAA